MNNMDNLQSYDNVEYLQANELSDEELYKYCSLKMKTAQSNAEFIEKYVWDNKPLNVCEIGGGNGKLLYCLEKKGLLRRGVNYEVSKSRCDLALRFAEILSINNVETRNCNFLDDKTDEGEFDCIVMVDIVLQLISPLYDSAESDMVQWLKKALKKGGYLFIEIVDYSNVMKRINKEGALHTWVEFPEADPFQYSLAELSIDKDNNLVCKKHFIGRNDNTRDYFKNVIRSYTREEVEELFTRNGFVTSVYSCHGDVSSDVERNNTFRIFAKKI